MINNKKKLKNRLSGFSINVNGLVVPLDCDTAKKRELKMSGLSTIVEMEVEIDVDVDVDYHLPKRHRRIGRQGRGCIGRQGRGCMGQIEVNVNPLANIWNVGLAYSDPKDGWVIEPPHSMKNLEDICPVVNTITNENFFSLYRSREKTPRGKIWKQFYLFKQFGEKKLFPDYQAICKSLSLNEIYELSFYILVTGAMKKEDNDRVKKLVYYCVGESIVSTEDVLGIMLKPGANPQISILISSETSTRAIQTFLMKNLGFTKKLSNNYDGTCIRKHHVNGKSNWI